ncbi:MAG: sigma-70 family RNA polymerase sigma factor [Planctomycetes bacterium]|nr:sigma-70 family RNA polymerase sigma factor [Planctomycetota bacterium]MCC7172083.1 sigma-70 family RNA polymerase sigma factor [Planctomycetota bacterium]
MHDVPEQIIERARAGDESAVRAIVEHLQVPMYQTVHRLIGGRLANDVEDVTQEIFLKVFRTLDRFDPRRGVRFTTWVYAYVKNHCFDLLKKRRLNAISLDAEASSTGDDMQPRFEPEGATLQPSDQMSAAEIDRLVRAAVDELPEDQRVAFVLREYQDLDYREIAQVMECSEGTVKSRLHRAREALRQRLRRLKV